MADVDKTTSVLGSVHAGREASQVYTIVFDAKETPLGAGDSVLLFKPKQQIVRSVRVVVDRAEGAAATVDVGDDTDPDGFIAAADANDVTTDTVNSLTLTEGAPNTVAGYSAGKFYASEDTVKLAASVALSNAKLTVYAEVVNLY